MIRRYRKGFLVRTLKAAGHRATRLALTVLCILVVSAPVVLAQASDRVIVDAEIAFTSPITLASPTDALLLQGTFTAGEDLVYILTLSNLSPWPLSEFRLLNRYFTPESEQELSHLWELARLEPGQTVSEIIRYPVDDLDGASPADACHQLELNWSGGWSAFLIDCAGLGGATIWRIPLSEEMAVNEGEVVAQPLSLPEPVGRSKLGLHVTRNSSPAIMDFVRRAQPAVIAGVGDLGWFADVKRASPGTITLGRFEELDQTFTGDPEQRAREFVATFAGRYLAYPSVDFWMGWNEPVIRSVWQMEWYAAFEVERARLMHELGLRVAVGNFATGTPEADQFPAFMPALAAAKEYGGVFALHEYSAPTMLHGVGASIPGHEGRPDMGTLTLRYRFWYEHYLGPANLVVPLVITEAGIDGGVLAGHNPPFGGWRDFTGTRSQEIGIQTLETYLAEISWYDDELRRDPYVLGFAIFDAGDISGRWASFDITDELDAFAALALSKE